MLKVIINGYSGTMGKVLTKCVNEDKDLQLVCGASKDELDVPFKTYHKMSEVEELADVIIDFSHHSTIEDTLNYATKTKTPLVIATTGFNDEELGKVLMKGFIYALSQLDTLPSCLLFYNGGVKLTCKGSDVLEDLKNLEAMGVEILSCGTCLSHYQLNDDLQVGKVTNMYEIVEKQMLASGVIYP